MKYGYSLVASLLVLGLQPSGAFTSLPQKRAEVSKIGRITPSISSPIVSYNDNNKSASGLILASSENSNEASESSWAFNPLYASLWLGFLGFAAAGPGDFFSPADTAMITSYIENPSDPGFAEGFQLVFNYLGLLPIIIACTAVPQASQRGLPPLPFLVASFGAGYAGVGPYLSFRAPPREEFIPSEAGWFTRNVLESKLLGWGVVAGALFLPIYVGFADALLTDASAAVQSYADLFSASKFVSASSMDLLILNIVAATLIPRDLKLRLPDIDEQKARLIGASTLLVPVVGAALYCALRPALPANED
ncbi:expressed unknown protein [Seminavis robusta]|uniref:Uncharacterized protein n=1 Tax=Seminavis robusta TaxID=568900 RepID=A0A9N8DBE9_9STRA|nr:expressed unknown protein [Seminavis robusta]|eukprot:Sro75_g041290.1 n/a (307) ;mRNA; f:76629-77645